MVKKRSGKIRYYVTGICAFLIITGAAGGTTFAQKQHQSTISSLKSELSNKDQVVEDSSTLIAKQQIKLDQQEEQLKKKDSSLKTQKGIIAQQKADLNTQRLTLIQQDSILKARQNIINDQNTKLVSAHKLLNERNNQIQILQSDLKKVQVAKAKAPAVKQAKASTSHKNVKSSATASGKFQSGWTATYYSLSVASTGKRPGDAGYGVTASGRQATDGVTIAVDRRVIPLGTWLEIKMPDGRVIKRRADDTGSAVKGKHIDIFMNVKNDKQLHKLGRHPISVRILK